MRSIQRVASQWVSSPLKPCRWTPFRFAPQAGYAKLGALFRAAHVTLGDHVDFVDRLGVVPDTVESSVFLAVDIIRHLRPAPGQPTPLPDLLFLRSRSDHRPANRPASSLSQVLCIVGTPRPQPERNPL